MRDDMKRLLCERPRYHDHWGGAPSGRQKNKSYEDLPLQQSMSRAKYGTKMLNENLAPLRRYIAKQVGRRWNDVYSEMCKHIDAKNATERHILEHVDGYICITVIRTDATESRTGLVSHSALAGSQRYNRRLPINAGELYVDPDDNIIKVAKNLTKDKPKKIVDSPIRKIDKNAIAIKIEGIWYRGEVSQYSTAGVWYWYSTVPMEDRITTNRKYDKGYNRTEYTIDGRRYFHLPFGSDLSKYFGWPNTMQKVLGGSNYIMTSKRQLTSKELRSLNLKNDR